jgi:restriction endonuclease-like protein
MNKTATLKLIVDRQQRWAEARHLAVNASGRVSHLEDNLFAPLHAETRAEFEAGDGDEFGTADAVGKMYSLHSSSALVCNVFDYWRKRPMLPLLRACGIETIATDLRFEQKFLTGVGSRPANLDVLITDTGGRNLPIAVESKFTEPFQTGERDHLRPAYFRKSETWDELPSCRGLAESLTAKQRYKCLKAGQLLKHALALTRKFGKKRFVLLYLWCDVRGSEAAKQHGDEVQNFANTVGSEVLFRNDTYLSVFQRLSPLASGSQYEKYLRSRYFE